MKQILLSVFFLVTTTFATKITDEGTDFAAGGYTSFTNFLVNSPNVKDSSFFLKADEKQSLPEDSTYELQFSKRGKPHTYTDNLWGYSTGNEVFVSISHGAMMTQKFRKLSLREFFSYYSEPFKNHSMALGGKMSDPDMIGMRYFILDMKSGKKATLNKPAMREILRQEDTLLYQQFLADSRSEERIIQYLETLNQRLSEKF